MSESQEACKRWVIVTQVKSNRVVYFTDDENYSPSTDSDLYYYSPYVGVLPLEMTLRTSWGWRFNGGVFSDAREKAHATQQETLIQSNKKAIRAILIEKINQIRTPYFSSCVGGDEIRKIKLAEAQKYLANEDISTDQSEFALLIVVSQARSIPVMQAAQLIVRKAEQMQEMLEQSERFREQFEQAIESAQTQEALLELREWIMDKVYPELSRQFKFNIRNTEPIDWKSPLSALHRRHEVARLKAQLRDFINAKRASVQSDYLQNDEVQKQKARIAQVVLAHQGEVPNNFDVTLLKNYANARQLSLQEAAKFILDSLVNTAEILEKTEAQKDYWLAKIDDIQTHLDIQAIETEFKKIEATNEMALSFQQK